MNRTKILLWSVVIVSAALMLGGGVWAMSSDNYGIDWSVISGGGEPSNSDSYTMRSTVGQPAVGTSTSASYTLESGYWHRMATPGANQAPNTPTNPSPGDSATAFIPVTLSVLVSDPDGDAMDITFHDASDGSVIDTATGVASGDRAAVTWSGLAANTTYSWYATACDGEPLCTTSDTWWNFTTGEEWDPWAYDENQDGIIQKMEAIHAIQDYFSGKISKAQAIEVIMLYFA
ncbi:MAG: hypothetical protein JW732_08980 [Dehalococcoidia bacterium]|nr:hypothetical protein [Dehalococcoidia bacterium]